MHSHCRVSFGAILLVVLSVSFVCAPAHAQRRATKFKKGDRVEVREFSDWIPGTVVGFHATGWLEVKTDKLDDSSSKEGGGFGRSFHHESSTRGYPPDDVRPAKKLKPAAAERTWTDRTGKFSVKARFQEVKGANVVLAKADGKTIQVALEKLSDGDAGYVKGVTEANENPFVESGASTAAAAVDSGPSKKANWHEAKQIRPQTFAKWSFTPRGSSSTEMMQLAAGSDIAVPLHDIDGSDKFFEKVDGIYASHDGNRVVVCRTEGKVAQDKQQFLELVDVAKQHAGALTPLPENTKLLDVDADAGLVMYRPEATGFGNKTQLSIARLESEKLVPVAQWEPYDQEKWEPQRDVGNGWFLGGNRVMTINEHGHALTIWDFDSVKALVNIPVSESFTLKTALSPDRKLLAIVMSEGIAIIDVAAGRHVATIPAKGQDISRVEFRGNNARLAGMSNRGVTVWDLTNGRVAADLYSDVLSSFSSLAWAGEYLLVQNRFLFDVNRRIILWEYQNGDGFGTTAALRDGRMFFVPKVERNSETTLVSAPIPHGAALELAKQLPSAEELLVVRPGDAVSIEVDIDPSVQLTDEVQRALNANVQDAKNSDAKDSKIVLLNPGAAQSDLVRQSLAAGLQASGLKVVDHSDLALKAVCKPQPQQTIRVNVDGRFPPRPTDIVERTITPHASYLEMKLGNTVLWKRGFVARPFMVIYVQKGETLDQALDRLTRPNFGLFTNNRFSAYIARPGKASENGAYGVSQFTARGLIDGKSSAGGSTAFE